jgi:hypothetical protein
MLISVVTAHNSPPAPLRRAEHATARMHVLLGVADDTQQPAHAGARLLALHGAAAVQNHHQPLPAGAEQAELQRVCAASSARACTSVIAASHRRLVRRALTR